MHQDFEFASQSTRLFGFVRGVSGPVTPIVLAVVMAKVAYSVMEGFKRMAVGPRFGVCCFSEFILVKGYDDCPSRQRLECREALWSALTEGQGAALPRLHRCRAPGKVSSCLCRLFSRCHQRRGYEECTSSYAALSGGRQRCRAVTCHRISRRCRTFISSLAFDPIDQCLHALFCQLFVSGNHKHTSCEGRQIGCGRGRSYESRKQNDETPYKTNPEHGFTSDGGG